jgi:hypothetical protein
MLRRAIFLISGALFLAAPGFASSPTAPPLPAPSGRIIDVSTEPQLQQAFRSLTSDTTVLIQPGTYRLAGTLHVSGSLSNVTVRGATDNRDDVVLIGPGMTNASVPNGVWTGGGVTRITIANLTIRDFYNHCVILNAGTEFPRLYNLRLLNAGQQIVKSNPDGAGGGVDDGLVEYSIIEYSTTSRDFYTNGVDVLGGRRWTIRHNLFRNIRAPAGQLAGPAVLMWRGTADSVTEGNTFIDCQRAVAYGLDPTSPPDHTGGIIRNNFIYRRSSQPGDAGIIVFGSPNTIVAHNTILLSGTYGGAIEYRFPQTTNVQIVNNLTDAGIVQRDGGTAALSGNYTQASAAMFLDASTGDLHLVESAANAIDRGVDFATAVPTDWDGQQRYQGDRPDIGADELGRPSGTAPGPPQNVRIIR